MARGSGASNTGAACTIYLKVNGPFNGDLTPRQVDSRQLCLQRSGDSDRVLQGERMRVYDESTKRRTQFSIQVNWSRERAFSERQRSWIHDNIPHARGVYVVYLRDDVYGYRRRRKSPILYFGSGWLDERLFAHVDGRGNQTLADHLAEDLLAFRWAEIQDDDNHNWPVVVEGILVYEFARLYGKLPPANRVSPPRRPMFEFSLIDQHPFDVIDEL